jgi:hypothetical protein
VHILFFAIIIRNSQVKKLSLRRAICYKNHFNIVNSCIYNTLIKSLLIGGFLIYMNVQLTSEEWEGLYKRAHE